MLHITLNNTDYYYTKSGSGIPIIFAHGLFVDHSIFKFQISALEEKFCCYSFDMPGHGHTSYDKRGWALDDIVEDFRLFIAKNNLEKVVLVGQSQGGMVFMRFAIKYPELVSKLVLIGTSARAEFEDRIEFWNKRIERFRSGNNEYYKQDVEAIQKNVVSQFFLENSSEEAEQELMIMKSQSPFAMALGIDSAILKRNDITEDLSEIKCPTLIICGADDHATPPEISFEMKEKIKNSEVSIIANAAHHIPIENPTELNSSLLGFLTR